MTTKASTRSARVRTYSGNITCDVLTRADGTVEPEVCHGELTQCTQDVMGDGSCKTVEAKNIRTRTDTYDFKKMTLLDLVCCRDRRSDSALCTPTLAKTIAAPR